MINIQQFRTEFPEFEDSGQYTNAMITFWGGVADVMLSKDRWGELYDQGRKLFIAHNIALASNNKASASSGAMPGQSGGITQSKAVGSVSVNYDTASAMELTAGHWNQTLYGRQYIRLVRMVGAGCYQL